VIYEVLQQVNMVP